VWLPEASKRSSQVPLPLGLVVLVLAGARDHRSPKDECVWNAQVTESPAIPEVQGSKRHHESAVFHALLTLVEVRLAVGTEGTGVDAGDPTYAV
jgi:hypothetical protein